MFDKKDESKHKWMNFNGSIVNLHYVIRVFSDAKKPTLTLEFHPAGKSEYEFHSIQDRDEVLARIFKYVT